MPKLTINGTEIEVPEGTNVVRAAEMAGQEIPHYCYHPGLSVAGNCRMCLVDVKALSEKQPNPLPKLQIGCNTIAQEGMVIESNSPKVDEARQGVLEFLLINHPIDCPICDQAGECKLQEYYMDYGAYQSRFTLEDKVQKAKAQPIGPNVMLDQERCILCTRCVRFLEEVTETNELCITERGDHSELTLARGKSVENDYSTNIVDICPVGALTSREFRFNARVWYLDTTPSICNGCATGCNIDVHTRERTIYRIKPRANAAVNGYWLCDHGRRTFKGNDDDSRLSSSYSRSDEQFLETSAVTASARAAADLLACSRVVVAVSAKVSLEEAFLAREIAALLPGGSAVALDDLPSDIADDGFLISSDRSPNRRGLELLGIRPDDGSLAAADGLLLIGADPAGDDPEVWDPRLENLKTFVHAFDRMGPTSGYADHILGLASHFECEGSYANRDGRIQLFHQAVAAIGSAVPGWQALAAVLAELGGQHHETVDSVFEELASSIGLGSGRTRSWVGEGGHAPAEPSNPGTAAETTVAPN